MKEHKQARLHPDQEFREEILGAYCTEDAQEFRNNKRKDTQRKRGMKDLEETEVLT